MKIKGVIFDFNGTLFWDTKLHNTAWDLFLENHKIKLSDHEKNETLHGKNNSDILNMLFNRTLTDGVNAKMSMEKELIYQSLCLSTEMHLAPGAISFLTFLKKNKIPYTIATASSRINVDFYFEHLDLASYFDRSKVIYNNGSIKSKPHPQLFQNAMDVLELAGSEVLIFEDSISGIRAAENALAGEIIIVNSTDDNYSNWKYPVIKDFREVDQSIFKQSFLR